MVSSSSEYKTRETKNIKFESGKYFLLRLAKNQMIRSESEQADQSLCCPPEDALDH